MADQPQPKYDPVRVTEIAAASSSFEVDLMFRRSVFQILPDGSVTSESVPTAALAMTWEIAKQFRDTLTRVIDDHEKMFGKIADIPSTEQTQSIN